MTKETKNRIHLIYGIVLSVVAVICGVLFILSAMNLYQTGLATDTQPYTVQTISAAFSKIAIPVYLCLALVIGGMVLNIVLPQEKKKVAPEKNRQLILQRLQAKTDLSGCEEGLRASIEKQEQARKLHKLISGLLLAAATGLFLSYACDSSHWHETDFNASMIRGFFALVICLVIPFIYIVFTTFFCRKSLDKQIELMRQASNLSPFKGEKPAPTEKGQKLESIVRYSVLVFAVGILVYGLATGGTVDVLAKAATICTECVGLG